MPTSPCLAVLKDRVYRAFSSNSTILHLRQHDSIMSPEVRPDALWYSRALPSSTKLSGERILPKSPKTFHAISMVSDMHLCMIENRHIENSIQPRHSTVGYFIGSSIAAVVWAWLHIVRNGCSICTWVTWWQSRMMEIGSFLKLRNCLVFFVADAQPPARSLWPIARSIILGRMSLMWHRNLYMWFWTCGLLLTHILYQTWSIRVSDLGTRNSYLDSVLSIS